MCGSDTLAMEVSSTSMNVASVTVRAISHGLNLGFQGFQCVRHVSSILGRIGCQILYAAELHLRAFQSPATAKILH